MRMSTSQRVWLSVSIVAMVLSFAVSLRLRAAEEAKGNAGENSQVSERYFEMRTYYASPGKLDALNARFRDHTNKLFVKHGMELVGYWTPAEGDGAQNTLIYILAYPDRASRDRSWEAFVNDPEWKKAKAASEADGTPLAAKVESVFLKPTDYSPIK